MSPISSVQQGVVAQYECAKLLILGTDGQVEPAVPVSDDDRRDFEVHVKGDFRANLALQVKERYFSAAPVSLLQPGDQLPCAERPAHFGSVVLVPDHVSGPGAYGLTGSSLPR